MSAQRTIIETVELTKIYGMGEVSVRALDQVDIQIQAGEFLAIMGSSGSGKSTLLHILGCLSRPTSGKYLLDGEDVSDLDMVQLAGIRNRKIGFVFQAYNLLARTTALRNIALPLLYDRVHPQNRTEGDQRAREMLKLVGLEDRADHHPSELSGGQQQRVAIARALVNNPVLVIADEPTGNLDSRSGAEIMDLLEMLNDRGVTIVIVTHDAKIASRVHRIISLADGRIVHTVENGKLKKEAGHANS
jgi:putative ABC transport system ATP-binding protein